MLLQEGTGISLMLAALNATDNTHLLVVCHTSPNLRFSHRAIANHDPIEEVSNEIATEHG